MCRIRNCVVAVQTILWFERPRHRGSIPGRDKRFLPYPMRDTKPPIDCTTGYISLWIKKLGCEANHLPPPNANDKMTGAKPALPLFMTSTITTLPSFPQEDCRCRSTGLNRTFMKASQTCRTLVTKIIGLYPRSSCTFDLVANCVG
jgi:hypothetical protein